MGHDGNTHAPTDSDSWQVKARDLEDTVRGLTQAFVNLQHRVSQLDGEELDWPADTYEDRTVDS